MATVAVVIETVETVTVVDAIGTVAGKLAWKIFHRQLAYSKLSLFLFETFLRRLTCCNEVLAG